MRYRVLGISRPSSVDQRYQSSIPDNSRIRIRSEGVQPPPRTEQSKRRRFAQCQSYRASPGFTRNHAAYSAGRNTRVSTVPTIRPPMIEIAIEP